ncbi:hypothetical protein D8B21_21940, partial [Verminephrobacter aporrectodeae subsp. tuberculatae]
TPTANVNAGGNTIGLDLSRISDLAGNVPRGTAVSRPYSIDTRNTPATEGPTLAAIDPITIGDAKLSLGESTTVTIRFSEAIRGLTIADLSVGGRARLSNDLS